MKITMIIAILTVAGMLTGGFLPMNSSHAGRVSESDFDAEWTAVLQDTMPRYGKDSVRCFRNWSVYDEYFRHNILEYAYEPWKYMFDHCPRATINIYIHGVRIVRYQYDHATDPEVKEEMLNTLMDIYDQRIAYFGDKGFVLGRKAAMLYQLQPGNAKDIFSYSDKSIELQGMQSETAVLLTNFHSVVRLVQAGVMDAEAIFDRYERATGIIDYNIREKPDQAQPYQSIRRNIEALFEPYASCDNLVRIYQPRFDSTPDDPELLRRITGFLESSGCTDEELFYHASTNLHQLSPDARSAFQMGRMERNRENHERAVEYFQEAVNLYQEDDKDAHAEQIFRAYLLMAEISFRQLGRLTAARRYARQAHETIPGDGRPLVLIGEMYAASADECGDDEFTRLTAYWPAVDKFLQAASEAGDEAVKDRAQQLAETYRQYFPNNELIFFYGHSPGDTYRVECWINKNTTIRAR